MFAWWIRITITITDEGSEGTKDLVSFRYGSYKQTGYVLLQWADKADGCWFGELVELRSK